VGGDASSASGAKIWGSRHIVYAGSANSVCSRTVCTTAKINEADPTLSSVIKQR